jgi:F-type H+-transporting ATPase subunit b
MFITTAFADDAQTNDATHGTNTETGVAHDDAHTGSFPPFESSSFASQLLWLAICFGIFYYLMSKVALPRISGILEVRRDRIAKDLEEANRLKGESDAAIAAYEQELAEAKTRAHTIGHDAREKAKAEAEAERAKVEKKLGDQLAKAEDNIAKLKAEALAEVDGIAKDTATTLISQLIDGKVTDAEVAKAVSAVAGSAK